MYHIFFIHSYVDGHLGCFHDLGVEDSATVSCGMHVCFEFWSRNISCLPFFSVLSFPKFFFPLPLQAIC